MKLLKHLAINLVVLALLLAVMVPCGLAEGHLGHGHFVGIALFLSAVMTVVSSLACGPGTRPSVIFRCASAVLVLLFFLLMAGLISREPAFLQDASSYWRGAITSVILVVLQAIYDRRHFGAMLGLCNVE